MNMIWKKKKKKICHGVLKKSQKWLSIEIAAPCNYFLCILPNPEIDVVKIAVENVFEFAEIIQSCWNMWIVGHLSYEVNATTNCIRLCTTVCDIQQKWRHLVPKYVINTS